MPGVIAKLISDSASPWCRYNDIGGEIVSPQVKLIYLLLTVAHKLDFVDSQLCGAVQVWWVLGL